MRVYHQDCEVWQMQCHTFPVTGITSTWLYIILLVNDRGTHMWTKCQQLLYEVVQPEVKPVRCWSQVNYNPCTTKPCHSVKYIKTCNLIYLYNMVRNLHQKRTKSCARCDLWARGRGQQNEDRGSTTPTLCCWHRWRRCLTTAMWHKSTEGRASATQHVSLRGVRHHNVSDSGAAAAANQCWHIQHIPQRKASCFTHCNGKFQYTSLYTSLAPSNMERQSEVNTEKNTVCRQKKTSTLLYAMSLVRHSTSHTDKSTKYQNNNARITNL